MDLTSYVSRVPRAGETIMGDHFSTGTGGKGANQAVACSKLAHVSPGHAPLERGPLAKVKMVGAVGGDFFGQELISALESQSVDCSNVKRIEGESTGVAMIMVESSGENRIIVTLNANKKLAPADIGDTIPGDKPDLVILQLELDLKTVLHTISVAKKQGVPILLNPSPVRKLPEDVYQGLDHLIVNEMECRMLLGHANPARELTQEDMRKAGFSFVKKGVKNVVITLGPRGAFYFNHQHEFGFVPAQFHGDVVDTTGAGDTFTGAYALGVVRNKENFNIAFALEDGAHAAAWTVTARGALSSIPHLERLTLPNLRFDHSRRDELLAAIRAAKGDSIGISKEDAAMSVDKDSGDSPSNWALSEDDLDPVPEKRPSENGDGDERPAKRHCEDGA